jgi:HD-like signal output (HDOD) protein
MEPRAELKKRLEAGYSLPALSPVALQLVELASDEYCSTKDLVQLIEKDPSLAARLLKLANSVFFQSTVATTTLDQAVVRVGFHRVRVMALSVSLRDTFPMGKVGSLDYESFWRISLYRALIARAMAGTLPGTNPDEAFIAALIMEIGLPIFYDLFLKGRDDGLNLNLEPLETLLAWEKRDFGIDHRTVGELALRHWKFPEKIISCQHAPSAGSETQEGRRIRHLCIMASRLSQVFFKDAGGLHGIIDDCARLSGLDQAVISDILVSTLNQIEEIAESFRLEVSMQKDLLEIMEKANAALSEISEKICVSQGASQNGSLPSFDSLQGDQQVEAHTLQAVAHEIRNPLVAVGGFARKLAATLEPGSKTGRYVKIILEEAKRLEEVLSDMTDQGENYH